MRGKRGAQFSHEMTGKNVLGLLNYIFFTRLLLLKNISAIFIDASNKIKIMLYKNIQLFSVLFWIIMYMCGYWNIFLIKYFIRKLGCLVYWFCNLPSMGGRQEVINGELNLFGIWTERSLHCLYWEPWSCKPNGGIKPVCRESSLVNYCLLLICFGTRPVSTVHRCFNRTSFFMIPRAKIEKLFKTGL